MGPSRIERQCSLIGNQRSTLVCRLQFRPHPIRDIKRRLRTTSESFHGLRFRLIAVTCSQVLAVPSQKSHSSNTPLLRRSVRNLELRQYCVICTNSFHLWKPVSLGRERSHVPFFTVNVKASLSYTQVILYSRLCGGVISLQRVRH